MRGFKYRIYPKENQILKLEEMFCAKRYVWNCFLELNMKRFEKKLGILTYTEMSKLLTQLKQEHRWLYQCEKSVLQNVLKDLSKAYTTFLKGPMTYSEKTICSNCKVQNKQVKDLSIRTWVCPECGIKHNRDHNASKNILREGLKQIA